MLKRMLDIFVLRQDLDWSSLPQKIIGAVGDAIDEVEFCAPPVKHALALHVSTQPRVVNNSTLKDSETATVLISTVLLYRRIVHSEKHSQTQLLS